MNKFALPRDLVVLYIHCHTAPLLWSDIAMALPLNRRQLRVCIEVHRALHVQRPASGERETQRSSIEREGEKNDLECSYVPDCW